MTKSIGEIEGIVGYVDQRLSDKQKTAFCRRNNKNYFFYETRHSDYDMSVPVTIENKVSVNFCNTIITDKPLPLPDGGYIEIEWNEEEIEEITIK